MIRVTGRGEGGCGEVLVEMVRWMMVMIVVISENRGEEWDGFGWGGGMMVVSDGEALGLFFSKTRSDGEVVSSSTGGDDGRWWWW